eukprot:Gregarina_sp_Poly_1__10358@NODE_739_length_6515_cov_119_200527_g388_i1_p3_GENE_NODE_739_length_6515_cov_119_200527_g388_i1NODE_739_length_6515_cov_119_200527_g388_i1_p3_ORF_typecomplete_len352_score70_52MCM2_N/PF12619_8/1e13MCM_N/PF14551_6/1_3e07POTRA_TamA_1/PF17243_2/2e03POTRA_TamA_1/PF17243_2/0_56POTRA_TamA_1/PF17243_2/6_9e03_NODE_739_length_6515_cov_119_200527_g388_i13551410
MPPLTNLASPQNDDVSDQEELFSEAEEVLNDEEDELADDQRRRRQSDSDDEGEDLFDEGMQRDYEANPELDRYDEEMLDDSEQPELTAAERRKAEHVLRQRDRDRRSAAAERGASGGRAMGISGVSDLFANLGASSDEEEDEEFHAAELEKEETRRRLRRLREQAERALRPDPSLVEEALTSLPECRVEHGTRAMIHLKLWNERLEQLIAIIFEGLLWATPSSVELNDEDRPQPNVPPGGTLGTMQASQLSYYLEQIQTMVRDERLSFMVQWNHILDFCPRLTDWIKILPTEVFGTFDAVATKLTVLMYPKLYRKKSHFQQNSRISSHTLHHSLTHSNVLHRTRIMSNFLL